MMSSTFQIGPNVSRRSKQWRLSFILGKEVYRQNEERKTVLSLGHWVCQHPVALTGHRLVFSCGIHFG